MNYNDQTKDQKDTITKCMFVTILSWTRSNCVAVLFTQVCQTYVFIVVGDVGVVVVDIGNSGEQHSPVAGQGS